MRPKLPFCHFLKQKLWGTLRWHKAHYKSYQVNTFYLVNLTRLWASNCIFSDLKFWHLVLWQPLVLFWSIYIFLKHTIFENYIPALLRWFMWAQNTLILLHEMAKGRFWVSATSIGIVLGLHTSVCIGSITTFVLWEEIESFIFMNFTEKKKIGKQPWF